MKTLSLYVANQFQNITILKTMLLTLIIACTGMVSSEVWLKNGNSIAFNSIKITGDSVYLEDGKTEYWLNKKDVKNIVQFETEPGFSMERTVDKLYNFIPYPARSFYYRNIDGIKFLFFLILTTVACMFSVRALRWIWDEGKIMFGLQLDYWKTQSHLLALDEEEKAVLREFDIQDKEVLIVPANDCAVYRLMEKKVLKVLDRHDGHYYYNTLRPVLIEPMIKKLVTPAITGMIDMSDRNENAEKIMSARPNFVGIDIEIEL